MSKTGDKTKTLLNGTTLTASYVASSELFYVQDYTETTHYIDYTPGTNGNSLQYKIEFSNDGSTWYNEPNEAVSGSTATVTVKDRTYTSTSGSAQRVPVISMPVSDKFLRVLVKETAAGGFGTVTWNARRSKLK
jgi:hypothetical protein